MVNTTIDSQLINTPINPLLDAAGMGVGQSDAVLIQRAVLPFISQMSAAQFGIHSRVLFRFCFEWFKD